MADEHVVKRFKRMCRSGGDDGLDGVTIREGVIGEYEGLAGFHYLARRPATVTRVLVVECEDEGVARRFVERYGLSGDEGEATGQKTGPWHTRRGTGQRTDPWHTGGGRVIGVLVESMPSLGCRLREEALGGRYGGWGDRGAAARLLNEEVRCISRVVVHPQWRGMGLAVRLVREHIAGMRTPYVEALAAMGRVHPFFELGGMRAYRRWPLRRDQRLLDSMRWAGVEPWRLASAAWMGRWLDGEGEGEGVSAGRRALVDEELARWAGRGLNREERLKRARAELLCEPVYYLKAREERSDGERSGGGGEVDRAERPAGESAEQQRDAGGDV